MTLPVAQLPSRGTPAFRDPSLNPYPLTGTAVSWLLALIGVHGKCQEVGHFWVQMAPLSIVSKHRLAYFWDKAELACRAKGNSGLPFKAERGVTQGAPLSPKLVNILFDDVVRELL